MQLSRLFWAALLLKRDLEIKINSVYFLKTRYRRSGGTSLSFTSKSFLKIADLIVKDLEILITTLKSGC